MKKLINDFIDKTLNKISWFNLVSKRYTNFVSFSFLFGMIINFAIFIFYLICSIYYSSPWYFTFAVYYFLVFLNRVLTYLNLIKNLKKYFDNPKLFDKSSIINYTIVSILLIILGIILGLSIYMLTNIEPPVIKATIPAIVTATYTFYKFIMAIRNFIKVKKQDFFIKVFREIGFSDALASMLFLEVTMLYAFGSVGEKELFFIVITGSCISFLIIFITIFMLIKVLKEFKRKNQSTSTSS